VTDQLRKVAAQVVRRNQYQIANQPELPPLARLGAEKYGAEVCLRPGLRAVGVSAVLHYLDRDKALVFVDGADHTVGCAAGGPAPRERLVQGLAHTAGVDA
jgi:hypothetical protein